MNLSFTISTIFIALGIGLPQYIVDPEEKDRLEPTVQLDTTHNKKVEDLRTQIERHKKVEHENTVRKVHNCKEEIQIDPKLNA